MNDFLTKDARILSESKWELRKSKSEVDTSYSETALFPGFAGKNRSSKCVETAGFRSYHTQDNSFLGSGLNSD
jgi:hypothetical protein